MKIIAIVPIKHESTRVPGKNYKIMNNKPLYFYILETLQKCELINKIIVDTNSPIIKTGCNNHFPNIIVYDRPENLWDGNISTNILLKNIISDLKLDADIYLQTHVTNPLLTEKTIVDAINFYSNNFNEYDSLFTSKVIKNRLYDKNFKEINHDRFNLIPTQNLDPIYEENSCLYLFTKDLLFTQNSRVGPNAYIYPMSLIESQDIDWEEDFILTEMLMNVHK